ncbi:SIP domain-containing protein [Chryseobacterium sp. LAM-KRS1]|uniref:SIP domain-containing protein n=1 Tax=Chryseobacterium sp. LAM-KRS1 TaxID=2715754 RepID=UPI0015548704|nr:SIP domain-containing protein [Chryseobacterium sp. LAM-KRS1]
MSSLPKWINDAVENLLPSKFKDCTVTKATYISDDLKQITFETDLSDVYFEPAYAVGFRINDRDFRNYSPFHFDKEKGNFDILFHVHDTQAAGCHFINQLTAGDSIKMIIPRGKRFFDHEAKIHFSIGDETSLGSSIAIREAAEKTSKSFVCLHELEDPLSLEKLDLYGYYTSKNNWMAILNQINEFLHEERKAIENQEVTFYLTGNGKTMSFLRRYLKEKGVHSTNVRSQAYWIEGKKGL